MNRFRDWPYFVEAHALDLEPADDDVWKADFFELPILEAGRNGTQTRHTGSETRCEDKDLGTSCQE